MLHEAQLPSSSESKVGLHYNDTVALANYPSDIHPVMGCKFPDYMTGQSSHTVPFYIPFRALTNQDAANVLVAGKTMAMSFWANSASRLHPSEWSSGVAAGGSAALMVRRGWNSTRDAFTHIGEVQRYLLQPSIGQVVDWTFKGSS